VLLRRARRAARLGVALEELARELAAARREVAVLRRENAALRSSLMSSALRD
jgi:cell shape-determining protein MreC